MISVWQRLWDLWEMIRGCGHDHLSRVFADEFGLYRRCTDCGRRFSYTGVEFTTRNVPREAKTNGR